MNQHEREVRIHTRQGQRHTYTTLMPLARALAILAARGSRMRRLSWLEDAEGNRIDDEPVVDGEVLGQGLLVKTEGE